MTRIIAGTAKGRPLRVPDAGTRPTSDRVKESMFSMLEHRLGGFDGLRVLDLYAGSGALGLEAASRGANHVLLVERSAPAARVAEANILSTGLAQAKVVVADATVWSTSDAARVAEGWDVVLLDPPYDFPDAQVAQVIASLIDADSLADRCEILVERAKPRGGNAQFPWPRGLSPEPPRTYGDTVVHQAVCYRHEMEQVAVDDDLGGE